jgi:hypothetical protein
MTGRTLTGYRHDLQITDRPRSSWVLVLAAAALVVFARKMGV